MITFWLTLSHHIWHRHCGFSKPIYCSLTGNELNSKSCFLSKIQATLNRTRRNNFLQNSPIIYYYCQVELSACVHRCKQCVFKHCKSRNSSNNISQDKSHPNSGPERHSGGNLKVKPRKKARQENVFLCACFHVQQASSQVAERLHTCGVGVKWNERAWADHLKRLADCALRWGVVHERKLKPPLTRKTTLLKSVWQYQHVTVTVSFGFLLRSSKNCSSCHCSTYWTCHSL